MLIAGQPWRTIWEADDGSVEIIDQTRLPHAVEICTVRDLEGAVRAIAEMRVRGAPLIGVTAAYGMALALLAGADDADMEAHGRALCAARPTAINLRWAVRRVMAALSPLPSNERSEAALLLARQMADEDVQTNRRIGEHGAKLIQAVATGKTGPVEILTHCNAGWLATVDFGTALAPIYVAQEWGIPLHVWVDETRPRNQGAALTAFELGHQGVNHTVIVDNAGGHLMQHGRVDLCLVGADRITRAGDVANKIGTYLKALAAHDNDVPFYVAAPVSTIDWTLSDGVREIPIEERHGDEVTFTDGALENGGHGRVRSAAPGSVAANFGFDVTPARLVTGLVTESGVRRADEQSLSDLAPAH